MPVHAINGDLDSPDHLAMAERLVGTGTTTLVEGTAHHPNMERPRRCNEALHEILSIV